MFTFANHVRMKHRMRCKYRKSHTKWLT